MEFFDVVRNRYSCRKFDGRAVEPEQLKIILEAGRLAPTAKNLQEQKIYVVQSEDGLALIDELTACRFGASTVLVVAYDKNNVFTYPGGKHNSGVEDATIVATHMILAAQAQGVNSCWVNLIDPEQVAAAFKLPENEEVVLLMPLGYGTEEAKPSRLHGMRKELTETVTFI